MKPLRNIPEQPEIPEEICDQAKNLISQAFSLLGQKIEQLSKDLEDFNNKRAEIRGRFMMESDERPDVLYDFLYKDIGRIASYYAQVFRGRLTGVEESSVDRDVHETLLKGNVAVASGEFKSVDDIQSSTRRTIDPHDVITTDILSSLNEGGFVTQNITDATHGTLVLAQGTIVFIERSMLELAAMTIDMAMQSQSGKGVSSQDRMNRQTIKFVKDFLSKLVLPSAFVLRMPSGVQIAGTIKDSGMEEPISSYYFKHGAAGLAEVYMTDFSGLTARPCP